MSLIIEGKQFYTPKNRSGPKTREFLRDVGDEPVQIIGAYWTDRTESGYPSGTHIYMLFGKHMEAHTLCSKRDFYNFFEPCPAPPSPKPKRTTLIEQGL
jgi:hypothetical protein